jgi:hypothetical protein
VFLHVIRRNRSSDGIKNIDIWIVFFIASGHPEFYHDLQLTVIFLFDSLYISIFEVKFPYIRFMVYNVTFNNISVILCPVYIYNFVFKFEIPYTF